jgi:TPP-dependent pyruvate/acetoin dehydrogenase alpha subunit
VVFVCDNNQWAYSTPAYLEYGCERLSDRARAYGFAGVTVDGTDVLPVYREAKAAIDKARGGGGPTLIETVTLRMEGHAVHDDAFYVPSELHSAWAAQDPVERHRAFLIERAGFTAPEDEELRAGVKEELRQALSRAEASPLPDAASVADGVYAQV